MVSDGFLTESPLPADPPNLSWRSALILQYRAFCDALRVPLQLLGTTRPTIPDLKALCLAVRNCTHFTAVKVEGGSALGDDAVACVALALGVQHGIRSVSISDVGFGRIGVEALAMALAAHEGPDPVQSLTLFGAHISPSAVRSLMTALPNGLLALDLADCHLNSKSIAQLFQALSPSFLQHLNLSRAACARLGSEALAGFLSRACALQELIVVDAQLDTIPVIDAIVENRALPLRALNLTGNRLTKPACLFLAEYLSRGHTLQELVLSEVKAAAADLDIVLCASVNNQIRSPVQSALKLDLSYCEIGTYGLFSMVQRRLKVMHSRLHVLDLSDCKLGYHGLANVLSLSLNIQSLETLILSYNARSTIFNKGVVELRDVLAQVSRQAALRHLVLDENGGGGNSLPSAVFVPMFETLSLTSGLQYLSLSGHHINEATFLILASALRTNRGLIYLNIDRNYSTFRSVSALADSIRYNDTLCHVHVEDDLVRLLQRSSSSATSSASIQAISESIRTRTQLNRRRRYYDRDEDLEEPITFTCRDLRLNRCGQRRRPSVSILPDHSATGSESGVYCPQFGMDVAAYEIVSYPGYEPGLPRVLLQLQSLVLAQQGLHTEGIFRVAPDAQLQAEVKKALDNGADPGSLHPSAACGANLVKIWFRHLPNRILAPAVHLFNGHEVELGDVLARLSDRARAILLWLLDLCALVSLHTASNKMTPRSLAIVFAPNLIHDDQLSAFGDDPIEVLRRSQEVAQSMESWIMERINRNHQSVIGLAENGQEAFVARTVSDSYLSTETSEAQPRQFHSMPRTSRLHFQRAVMGENKEVHTIR